MHAKVHYEPWIRLERHREAVPPKVYGSVSVVLRSIRDTNFVHYSFMDTWNLVSVTLQKRLQDEMGSVGGVSGAHGLSEGYSFS